MTAINLDTEIVATRYDAAARECSYTLERNGRRWTVRIPIKEFDAMGPLSLTKPQRRAHVANRLQAALSSAPDSSTHANPARPATWQDFDLLPSGTWYLNPADGKLQQKP